MNKFDELIPGMEAFMEDTEVSVDVAVGDTAEVEEEIAVAEEQTEEVAESAAEVEETDEQAEMILRRFEELQFMHDHVEKYGVDRTFLALCNRNDVLGKSFRISLPSCESFDAVGSPSSAESIACLEGFKETMGKIWDFIKSVADKVWKAIKGFFSAIWNMITGIDRTIKRLREAANTRKWRETSDKYFENRKVKFVEVSDVPANPADASKLLDEASKLSGNVAAIIASGKDADQNLINNIKELKTQAEEYSKKFDGVELKVSESKKGDEVSMSECANKAKCTKYIDDAEALKKKLDLMKSFERTTEAALNNIKKMAAAGEKRGDDVAKNLKEAAREAASAVKSASKCGPEIAKSNMKMIKANLRNATMMINYGTTK